MNESSSCFRAARASSRICRSSLYLTTTSSRAPSRLATWGVGRPISEPSRSATYEAINIAKDRGALISYDPNLRLNLWSEAELARERILEAWPLAQVIKVSEEEVAFLSEEYDILAGSSELWHENLRLLVLTKGSEGCAFKTRDTYEDIPGFNVDVVDTTGAGDGFVAGLLKGLFEQPRAWKNINDLRRICLYANAVGALTTTRRGAIPGLPTSVEVEKFLGIAGTGWMGLAAT